MAAPTALYLSFSLLLSSSPIVAITASFSPHTVHAATGAATSPPHTTTSLLLLAAQFISVVPPLAAPNRCPLFPLPTTAFNGPHLWPLTTPSLLPAAVLFFLCQPWPLIQPIYRPSLPAAPSSAAALICRLQPT
ncbi:hypothetical protein B296_00050688 [Ensete ventricosum]|uniref:Uncharacterized protein n=1 Tax=Ensete ventricosum TaxID=4639 RepID=A0A426YK20_ENSVE|nr:hypothetical protein B296_00050688 [Ensete ventricosum]